MFHVLFDDHALSSFIKSELFAQYYLSLDLVQNSDLMWKQSVWTSVIAAGLGSKYLKDNGVLVLTGAQAALKGTPGEFSSWNCQKCL